MSNQLLGTQPKISSVIPQLDTEKVEKNATAEWKK
jgi:hypothetical protein